MKTILLICFLILIAGTFLWVYLLHHRGILLKHNHIMILPFTYVAWVYVMPILEAKVSLPKDLYRNYFNRILNIWFYYELVLWIVISWLFIEKVIVYKSLMMSRLSPKYPSSRVSLHTKSGNAPSGMSNLVARRDSDGHLRWIDSKRAETLSTLLKRKTEMFTDLFHRNMGRGLINYLLRVADSIFPRRNSNLVKQICSFSKFCYNYQRYSGIKGLTLYLKTCQIILQQSIGGYKVKDLTEFKVRVKRNRYGSPYIIPRSARRAIHRDFDRKVISLWMTLFGLYRILSFPGKLKLSTITQPFTVSEKFLKDWTEFIINKWEVFIPNTIEPPKLYPIQTSSPTSSILRRLKPALPDSKPLASTSFMSMWASSVLWIQDKDLFQKFTDFSKAMGYPFFPARMKVLNDAHVPDYVPLSEEGIQHSNMIEAMVLDRNLGKDTFMGSDDLKNWDTPEMEWSRYRKLSAVEREEIFKKKYYSNATGYLGKLGLKFEPAGKVRVFAMVDCWTQWLMRPLHLLIFEILSRFRTDGTFNQSAPIARLTRIFKFPHGWVPKTTFYSLDLSAATDRLPVVLQKTVIEKIFLSLGKNSDDAKVISELWRSILVDRTYYYHISFMESLMMLSPREIKHFCRSVSIEYKEFLRSLKKGSLRSKPYYSDLKAFMAERIEPFGKLRYAVGQPMGALSSWAMLALVHHAIVAFAAHKAKMKRFTNYAVLGDDIIIANSRVALSYLSILREIGVEVNLAKSIISPRRFVLEFAKKFFVNSGTANMIPLKDCISSWASNSLLKEFAEKYSLSVNQLLSFIGYGYKAKSKFINSNVWDLGHRSRVNLVWWSMLGSHPRIRHWFEWVSLKTYHSSYDIKDSKVLFDVLQIAILYHKKYKLQFKEAYESWKLSIVKLSIEGNKQVQILENKPTNPNSNMMGIWLVEFEKAQIYWDQFLSIPISDPVVDLPVSGHSHVSRSGVVDDLELKVNASLEADIILYEKIEECIRNYTSFDSFFIDFNIFLDTLLDDIFNGDLMAQIPKEFWPDKRSSEKLFDDFNRTYSIWVKLNAPISKYIGSRKRDAALEKSKRRGYVEDYPIVLSMDLVPVSSVRDHGIEMSPGLLAEKKRAVFKFGALWNEFLKVLKWASIVIGWASVFYLVRRGPEVQYIKEIVTVWKDSPPEIVYQIIEKIVPKDTSNSIFDSIWFWLLLIFGFGIILLLFHNMYLSNLNLAYDLEVAKAQATLAMDSALSRQEKMSETIARLSRNIQDGADRETSALSMFETEMEAMLTTQKSLLLEIEGLKSRDGLFSVTRDSILTRINHEQDNLRDQLIKCLEQLTSGTNVPGLDDLIALYRKELSSTQAKIDFLTDPAVLNSHEYALRISNILIPRIGQDPDIANSNILDTVANNFMHHYQVTGEFILSSLFDSVI